MATLFISDLHLDPGRPAIVDLFLRFLTQEASHGESLYILGDLFETWIGDDDDCALGQQVKAELKRLSKRSVPVYLMVGNRDFLLGKEFAAASGAILLKDPWVVDLYDIPTLLMHGDTLCTDDVAYQQFRTQVRSPEWQASLLARPLAERRILAKRLRDGSQQATQGKPPSIMDVNAQAVIDTMEAYGVHRLIHGHTHRAAIHEWIMRGESAQRIVLGDWYTHGSVLYCDASGCRLEALTLS
jgi:UDP-2,3-diacylglucosamine hydrolase